MLLGLYFSITRVTFVVVFLVCKFEDTEAEDVTNWTNRSPYPLFHLLLEKDVTVAVDAYDGDTDAIWETNQVPR